MNFPDAERVIAGKWQPASKHYINGPRMHEWLKELKERISHDFPGKDLMLVGELPLTPYSELLRYVNPAEQELSMVFDFDVIKLGNNGMSFICILLAILEIIADSLPCSFRQPRRVRQA